LDIEMRYTACGDASIAYQVIGQGDVDIVYVPCWLSHLERMWREPRFMRFMESLAGFGRLITFDKRGTGLSDPAPAVPGQTLEARMEDLLAVMDAAQSRRAILVGAGIGSRLSALFAATYPERVAGLALIAASARGTWAPDYPMARTVEEHEAQIELTERTWGGPVWIDTYATSLANDASFCAWWAECLRSAAGPAAATAMIRLYRDSDIREVLPSVQAPTLVLHRRGDQVIDIAEGRYMAEHIPGARFVELDGVDHLLFVGDQEQLVAELGLFITGVRPEPRVERVLGTAAVITVSGAARLAARLGDERWAEVRTAFRAILRTAQARHRGRATMVSLDSISAIFDGPARAIGFAADVVEQTRRLGLRASAGVHTGDVDLTGNEVGGAATLLAARVASLAAPGEVLTSGTVVGLAAGAGLAFETLTGRDQSSLPEGWQLYRLVPERVGQAPARGNPASAVLPMNVLTPREREVASLIAEGRSNREIGDALAISISTVERHVANMLLKLGFRSRAQVAAWSVSINQQTVTVPIPAPALLSAVAD
jgi:pimeloyl-ACP methyl ester carboxylesterase/DNA-binding CsgD family transcriptional regulator